MIGIGVGVCFDKLPKLYSDLSQDISLTSIASGEAIGTITAATIGQAVTAYGAGNYGAGAYGGIDSTANTVLTPSSIAHNSINQVTVTLSAAATGEVICVG